VQKDEPNKSWIWNVDASRLVHCDHILLANLQRSILNMSTVEIPRGYEEVPAGEHARLAQYRCGKCGQVFITGHYSGVRTATGQTVKCCGEPAWWIRNVKEKDGKQ
jgi:hypothetical protein